MARTTYYNDEGDLVVGQQALKQQTQSTQTIQGTTNTPDPTVYSPSNPGPTTGTASPPVYAAPATAAETHPQANGIVIIRDGDEYGGWNQLPPGTGTIILASDDPNLARDYATAKQAGYTVGIMVSASSSEDPASYGARLASIQNLYQPAVLVADTEFMQGGAHIDANWSQQALTAYGAAAQGTTQLAVTFMPTQTGDFPYGTWQSANSNVQFWPFTFGADPSDPAQLSDPQAVLNSVTAQGVSASSVTVMIAPGQTPLHGQGSLLYAPPPNYGGGGGNAFAGTTSGGVYTAGGDIVTGPHPIAPAPVPGETTKTPGATTGKPVLAQGDWAQVFFGSLGLPADVMGRIETIFQAHSADTNLAVGLAEQYLETTPWFATNFPGYQYGLRNGMFTDKTGYRDYVNRLNVLSNQFQNRPISGNEVVGYLGQGYTPGRVEQGFQGAAFVAANRSDMEYLAGAGGGGQLNEQELTALGNEKAGIDSQLGQLLTKRLQDAATRIAGLFQGQTQNPSLALGAQGLNAPSLLGQRGVDQRGSADLSA